MGFARTLLAICFALLTARAATACSLRTWEANDLVENPVVSSANGRFAAVVRWQQDVPDFGSQRAGEVFRLDDPPPLEQQEESGQPAPEPVTVALYESRTLIAAIPVGRDVLGSILVPDSGRFLVSVEEFFGCYGHAEPGDAFVTVFAANGARIGSLKVGDVFDAYDVRLIRWPNVHYELRHESETREVLVISVPLDRGGKHVVERRIDVATATPLDAKTDLFPKPRVSVTPVTERPAPPYEAAPADCAAAFDDPALVRVSTQELFDRAVDRPVPPFPDLLLKAHIRTKVLVEVAVSETGAVRCARATKFPFGADEVAAGALRQWRFSPLTAGGRRVPFVGELLVRFQDGAAAN